MKQQIIRKSSPFIKFGAPMVLFCVVGYMSLSKVCSGVNFHILVALSTIIVACHSLPIILPILSLLSSVRRRESSGKGC